MVKTKVNIKYEDIEREVYDGESVFIDKIDVELQKRIISQVEKEYNLAFKFNEEKRAQNLARLKLYNNQRRNSKAVGDPLMFTVFNTILASLYDDKLASLWEGRGGKGDEDVEENLNALAEYDYDLMHKAELDYYWIWDTLFFGRGLIAMLTFDRRIGKMCPVPENIDASIWIRDPKATSVNGDMQGKGAMRFGGYERGASYYELKKLKGYFNLGSLRKEKETNSLSDEASQARSEANGTITFRADEESLDKFGNYEFKLLDWYTTIKGEKYLVTLGNGIKTIHRLIKFTGLDNRWPIQDRTLYPMSNEWDGVSIPDLTEDKQRARATLLNISMESAKSEVTPSYLFDNTRIKNKHDLNLRINKFIPVEGRTDNAITPVNKSTAHQFATLIMDTLDYSVQRATSASNLRQGIQSTDNRTLGEQELAASGSDTRFSMSAKIFGWSEKGFWRLWYLLYKKHFKEDIDEKVVRISGALSPTWRPLTRENIISEVDPDVKIESRVVAEAKRMRDAQNFGNFLSIAIADPESSKRFLLQKAGRLQGMSKEELDMAFPQTVDELQAEDENILLNGEKMPKIDIRDDHLVHIEIHSKANQNAYTIAHVLQHKKMMVMKRNRPDLFPPKQGLQIPGQKPVEAPKPPVANNNVKETSKVPA